MTNKLAMRTVEQFIVDYKPNYAPIMALFLGNSLQYEATVGSIDFKRAEAIGDIRAKMHGPKDTTIHQIISKDGKKTFKRYFFGAQYIQSLLQTTEGYEDVLAQVLDEHNKQSDELLLLGEGTSASNMVNNGLYWSNDPNYILNASYEVAKATDGTHLADLFAKISSLIQTADEVDGQKLVMVYGATTIAKYNGLFASNSTSFAKVIGDANPGVSFAKLPTAITPAGASGVMVINLAQAKLHYTLLPGVQGQGTNEEKMYAWTNFLMGSSMLEVTAMGGVIRQPLTYAV